jgi:hypothetical protein
MLISWSLNWRKEDMCHRHIWGELTDKNLYIYIYIDTHTHTGWFRSLFAPVRTKVVGSGQSLCARTHAICTCLGSAHDVCHVTVSLTTTFIQPFVPLMDSELFGHMFLQVCRDFWITLYKWLEWHTFWTLSIVYPWSTNARHFGEWSLSPSSGKKRTPTLLGPIDRASPYPRMSCVFWSRIDNG